MKSLSIKQPWAWLIVNGYKDIENRTWSTNYRGRILIHAGLRQDYGAYEGDTTYRRLVPWIRDLVVPNGSFDWDTSMGIELGAIVGEVTITDCVTKSDSPWFVGDYGFVLIDPVAYETPIPYRGRQRWFEVEKTW